MRRQDLADDGQQRLLRVGARARQVEPEALGQLPGRCCVVLAALLHVVELEDDGPGVRRNRPASVRRVPG